MEPVNFNFRLVDRNGSVLAESNDAEALTANYLAEEMEQYQVRVETN